MKVLFNGQVLTEGELILPLHNRSFQYNDGFFETMTMIDGRVRFWADHLSRMQEAAAILRLELPAAFLEQDFLTQIAELAQQNVCGSLARVKLKAWRTGAGLYTPQNNEIEWLITAIPGQVPPTAPLQASICESVRTLPSPFSGYKGFNSPIYVLASQERATRGLDDVILLDPNGHLAELTASNLFWIQDQTLFTPSLETGCLNGIMRRNVLRWANRKGIQIQEGFFQTEVLHQAEVVFSGNVNGLRAVASLEDQELPQNHALLAQIQEEVFSPIV